MNLAEELYLCAIPPSGFITSPKVVVGVGGGLASELVLAERVRIEDEDVHVTDATPTGDPLLDPVLEGLADPRAASTRPSWFVASVGKTQFPRVHDRLIERGAVRLEKGDRRRLWFDKPDWMRIQPAGEEARRPLRVALLGDEEPDVRTAVLAGLAAACDLVKLHVPGDARKDAESRAEALGAGDAVPGHVRDAIKGAQAATAAAVVSAQG